MIKLRVEWRHTCPGCGVELVIDFLDDSGDRRTCPWCGHARDSDPRTEANGLRSYLARATRELEQTANDMIASPR